jgi:hypothetical protein
MVMKDNVHNLAITAGLYCDGTPDSFDTAAVEKFTLLLIEQCVTIMRENERIPEGFLYPKNVNIHELAIKTYFGITDNEQLT